MINIDRNATMPRMSGSSRLKTDWMKILPRPGIAKTYSTTTVPASNAASAGPVNDNTGTKPPRSA